VSCFACLCRAFIRSRDSLAGLLGISALLDQVPEMHEGIRTSGEAAVDTWLGASRPTAESETNTTAAPLPAVPAVQSN
jgi:hypothetical protein